MNHALVVDDEEDIRCLISDILEENGFKVTAVSDASAALEAIKLNNFNICILDVWLEGSTLDGLGILEFLRKNHPQLPVVMISGHGNIELAVYAIKLGAIDWIEKPFKIERLLLTVRQTIESFKLKQENTQLRKRNALTLKMVGNSPAIGALKANIEKLAACNSRVLITGGSGSGKELTARLLHKKSPKNLDPFVVYRAYRSQKYDLMEDFFGTSSKGGVFRRVNNGIVYIDEVSNLTTEAQNLLLKILQQQPIDDINTQKIYAQDFRVISSTHCTYEQLMGQGFNENLFQRLKVTTLRTPNLAEHKEDLKQLCEYFIDHIAHLTGIKPRPVSEEVIQLLQLYAWPGNIRELRLFAELMSINADIAGLDEINSNCVSHLLNGNTSSEPSPVNDISHELVNLSLRDAREQFEKRYLKMQIERCNGSISRTAAIIGMERSALHRKLKTLGVAINRNQIADEEMTEMEG